MEEEPLTKADDVEGCETKPSVPCESEGKDTHSPSKNVPSKVDLQLMNAKLAEKSAEYGGLLTPHFFMLSPGVSSPNCARQNDVSSSDMIHGQEISGISDCDPQDGRCTKSPFTFSTSTDNQDEHAEHTVHNLERIEINDDSNKESEEKLIEWSKKYIENKGFCLGVHPGSFYKHESQPFFYVKMPHRSNYEVIVTNNNQIACDMDLFVNGLPAAALRLPAETTRSIDGPQHSEYAFKFFRTKDLPPNKTVAEGASQNGIVKAVFTPSKMTGNARLRAASEPLRSGMAVSDILESLDDTETMKKQRSLTVGSDMAVSDILELLDDAETAKKQRLLTVSSVDEDKGERSLNISRVVEGVTILQGKKKVKDYVLAPEMETDPSKRVILQFKLIASLDEEEDDEENEIIPLEPPPLPTRR